MDSKHAHALTLRAPIASELLVCADKNGQKADFLLILGGYPCRVNRNSFAYVVRLFIRVRFPVARTAVSFIRVASIPVQRNLRSLVTPEIMQAIAMFIRLSIFRSKYLPLGCLSDAQLLSSTVNTITFREKRGDRNFKGVLFPSLVLNLCHAIASFSKTVHFLDFSLIHRTCCCSRAKQNK